MTDDILAGAALVLVLALACLTLAVL